METVTEKLTFDDLIDYFEKDIPKELGLKYPEANGKIARMIIEEEIINNNFLPSTMPARDRAAFSIPTFGNEINAEIKNKIDKYLLFATLLILKHRKGKHSTDENTLMAIQGEIEVIRIEIQKKGIIFSEKEYALLIYADGFWGPG